MNTYNIYRHLIIVTAITIIHLNVALRVTICKTYRPDTDLLLSEISDALVSLPPKTLDSLNIVFTKLDTISNENKPAHNDTIKYPPNIIELLKKGDKYYDQQFYIKANKYYVQALELIEDDREINLKVAETYRQNQQYAEAEIYYSKVLEEKSYSTPILYFNYADILLKNKKYKKAQKWYEYYNNLTGNNSPIAKKFIKSIENLDSYFNDSIYIHIKPLEINSSYSEFSPVLFKDNIIFVSSRQAGKTEVGKRYYDLYYSKFNDSLLTYSNPKRISNQLNTKFHEGPMVFYKEDSLVLLTRSNSVNKSNEDNLIKLSIYSATINNLDSKLIRLSKIEVEDFDYSMAHPAISKDGKTLLFVSNAPEGHGNTDIYSTTLVNSKWTNPVNLGAKINTERNEMFLYLQNDSILYFASDGHGGLGGLDIFRVNIYEDDPLIENLGYPINSNKDDFGLIFTKNIKQGYFSSNRSGGSRSDDIYSFEIKKVKFRPIYKSTETGKPITDINVKITDLQTNKIIARDSTKEFLQYNLLADKEYNISYSSDKYVKGSEIFRAETNDLTDILEPVLYTQEIKPDKISTIYFRVQVAASRVPLTEKKLRRRYKGDIEVTMFQEDGWYKYIIGEFDSYYESKELLKKSGVKDAFIAAYNNKIKLPLKQAISKKYVTPDQFKNLVTVLEAEQVDITEYFRIHFKPDESYITKNGKMILDSIIHIMLMNPDINIEIGGHTDRIGSFSYNMALSFERTKRVNNYIVKNGIDDKRILTKGYGESKLLNKCRKNCTEEMHKLNRRVEIVLYKNRTAGDKE